MSQQLQGRPGRKMALGRYVVDTKNGRFGVFIGYCDECNGKVIKDRQDLTALMRYVRKDERSRSHRLLQWLLGTRML